MAIEKILCVDDDKDILNIYRTLLEKNGFDVRTAEDGVECGCVLCEYQPDLIILDIAMPHMNGLKAIEYLKAGPLEELNILVVTGIEKPEVLADLREKGIKCLTKPVQLNHLIDSISEMSKKAA